MHVFVCVILGFLVDYMQNQCCICLIFLYLSCSCKSSDIVVLKVTVLTRTCRQWYNGSVTASISMLLMISDSPPSLIKSRNCENRYKLIVILRITDLYLFSSFCFCVCVCIFVHTSVSPALRQGGKTSQYPVKSLKCNIFPCR